MVFIFKFFISIILLLNIFMSVSCKIDLNDYDEPEGASECTNVEDISTLAKRTVCKNPSYSRYFAAIESFPESGVLDMENFKETFIKEMNSLLGVTEDDPEAEGIYSPGVTYQLIMNNSTRFEASQIVAKSYGFAKREIDNFSAYPPAPLIMSEYNHVLLGSVTKFVSGLIFFKFLQENIDNPSFNPKQLKLREIINLPLYHFLPKRFSVNIGQKTEDYVEMKNTLKNLSIEEAPIFENKNIDYINDTFKNITISQALRHKSRMGSTHAYGETDLRNNENLWFYLPFGSQTYMYDGLNSTRNPKINEYDYENVNYKALGYFYYFMKNPNAYKDWETEEMNQLKIDEFTFKLDKKIREFMTEEYKNFAVFVEGSPDDVTCSALSNPLSSSLYSNPEKEEDSKLTGASFDSVALNGGCMTQGSLFATSNIMGRIMFKYLRGEIVKSTIMTMIEGYEIANKTFKMDLMAFNEVTIDDDLQTKLNLIHNYLPIKKGDQKSNNHWKDVYGNNLPKGHIKRGGHAAIIRLPFDMMCFVAINGNGLSSSDLSSAVVTSFVKAWDSNFTP